MYKNFQYKQVIYTIIHSQVKTQKIFCDVHRVVTLTENMEDSPGELSDELVT